MRNVILIDREHHTKADRRFNDIHQKDVEVEISRQTLDAKG